MKKLLPKFYRVLSAVSFLVAAAFVVQWSLWISYQPECPEEIVK